MNNKKLNTEKEYGEFLEIHAYLSLTDVSYLCRNANLLCKCGKYRGIYKSKQSKIGYVLKKTCSSKECQYFFGKKRPEHSLIMKNLAKDTNSAFSKTLFTKGVLNNKTVNTIAFMRKVLSNKGYDNTQTISDEDIKVNYSKAVSKNMKNIEYKKKVIRTRLVNFEQKYIDLLLLKDVDYKNIDAYDNDVIEDIFLYTHSINSVRNLDNSLKIRNSFFKTDTIDSKYCLNNKTVTFRSGWEYETVKIFEENKIYWEYEPLYLMCLDKKSIYIPDFIFHYEGQKIILEVKGSFYNTNEKQYSLNKLFAAEIWAKENNSLFRILYVKPKKLEDILTKMIPLRLELNND